jgi:uncharacterized protein YerC
MLKVLYKSEPLCYAKGIVMRLDKNQALKLRLQGKSYNEINKALGIPKATLSEWFTGLELSENAKNRISQRVHQGSMKGLIKKNKLQTHLAQQRARTVRTEAKKEIGKLTARELLILGTALYWAEGYKRPIIKNGKAKSYHPVSLSNSDPALVAIFLKFLREICKAEESKIHAGIRILNSY